MNWWFEMKANDVRLKKSVNRHWLSCGINTSHRFLSTEEKNTDFKWKFILLCYIKYFLTK